MRDRFHPVGHGGFFDREFARKYWLPFFERDFIVRSTGEGLESRAAAPWWQTFISTFKIWWGVAIIGTYLTFSSVSSYIRAGDERSLEVRNIEKIEPGQSANYINGLLGPAKVQANVLIKCDYDQIPALYRRWNNSDYSVQMIILSGTLRAFVAQLLRGPPVEGGLRVLGSKLGGETFKGLGDHPMDRFITNDARYPAYIEYQYFGRAGDYHDYYYSINSSQTFLESAEIMVTRRDELTGAADSESYPLSSDELRARSFPGSVAVLDDLSECETSSLKDYVIGIVSVPFYWYETGL